MKRESSTGMQTGVAACRSSSRMPTLVGGGAAGGRPSTIELSISGRNTFGRAKRPDGALLTDHHHSILGKNGDSISRYHATITSQQLPDGTRCWLLKDNNSKNGLFLNRVRVNSHPSIGTRLEKGDQIAFGG